MSSTNTSKKLRAAFAALAIFGAGALAAPPALAQPPHHDARHDEGDDPIERLLFPPELVMRHATALGLSGDQQQGIVDAVGELQGDMTRVHLEMEVMHGDLAMALEEDVIDEEHVLALLERVLEHENMVKTAHIALLVRIRNELSTQQREQLSAFRDRR